MALSLVREFAYEEDGVETEGEESIVSRVDTSIDALLGPNPAMHHNALRFY